MNRKFFLMCHIVTLAFITTTFTLAPNVNASVITNPATWSMFDNLSSNAKWSCWASEITPGIANGCEYLKGTYIVNARYWGIGVTDVYDVHGVTGWSDVGRPVSLGGFHPPYSFLPTIWCKAQMTVLPNILTSPDAQLEVINATEWTYITTKRIKYSPSVPLNESVITTPSWIPAVKDVFVRIGIIGNGQYNALYVDGLTVSCTL